MEGANILSMGMITAVGIGAEQTAASVRAGIARFSETSIYSKRFEPFRMALLPDEALPPLASELDNATGLTSRQARMLQLAAPALKEALKNTADAKDIPVYLGGPEQMKDRPKPINDNFFKQLGIQSGLNFNAAESKIFLEGRAAGLFALKEAMALISSGKKQFVLVGGVDTYLDLYLLGTMDMEDRILGGNVMDGFIPGEGAAFVLLTNANKSRAADMPPLAKLSMVSSGFEEGHLYSEKPYQGEGLAATFDSFFKANGLNESIKEVYTSINGENHWAKEWGIAFVRSTAAFDPSHGIHHPADCFGDTGAASGIILIILAAVGFKRGYRRSPALVTCSSDYGNRAAVAVISTP